MMREILLFNIDNIFFKVEEDFIHTGESVAALSKILSEYNNMDVYE